MNNYDLLVERIVKQSGMPQEQVESKINNKIQEYGGLLTDEGAAYSVAKELNISFNDDLDLKTATQDAQEETKIKNLAEQMYNISFKARIDTIYETRHWDKGTSKGCVTNTFIADDTGRTKLVIWNKEELANQLSEGDFIQVTNAYTKRNMNNYLEVHASDKTTITKIDAVPELEIKFTNIEQLKDQDKNKFIQAVVSEVYNPVMITVCSKCGSINHKCSHDVEHKKSLVVNLNLDDNTGNIRGVLFRNKAEQFLNMTGEQYAANQSLFDEKKNQLLGKKFKLMGNVKEDKDWNRKDFIINSFTQI